MQHRAGATCHVIAALCAATAGAVIIDRIAVIAGTAVIKDSDIERDIRLTDFLNGDKLDSSPAERRKAAQRLIEQALIRHEIQLAHYPTASPEEVRKFMAEVQQQRSTQKEYGISDAELETRIRWQIDVLHFIDQRFRPGVQVTDKEIEDYQKTHPSYPVEEIQDILAAPKVDQEFNAWLKRTRERTKIEYREPGLE